MRHQIAAIGAFTEKCVEPDTRSRPGQKCQSCRLPGEKFQIDCRIDSEPPDPLKRSQRIHSGPEKALVTNCDDILFGDQIHQAEIESILFKHEKSNMLSAIHLDRTRYRMLCQHG